MAKETHVGKKLMETNCYVCHAVSGAKENRIAPPMISIKEHYISENTTKEEFIAAMQNWIKNPTEENVKMHNAVKQFGIMPRQHYPENTIQKIAEYMFNNDIEKPVWHKENDKERAKQKHKQATNFTNLPYDERGLKYALSTKAVLGKNLMGKIQKEGTLAALDFCNIKAFPLTDSMSVVHKATIKRVSDKPRNYKNKANSLENEYITIFKEDAKANKESKPIVVETAKNVKVYYPIKTNGMCLQCHGKPNSDIKPNTLTQINKLYPKDLAKGYSENQIRGIWNVSFQK
ncbi:MAG: c-type heme family protein [Flavobacteriales bacterium]